MFDKMVVLLVSSLMVFGVLAMAHSADSLNVNVNNYVMSQK